MNIKWNHLTAILKEYQGKIRGTRNSIDEVRDLLNEIRSLNLTVLASIRQGDNVGLNSDYVIESNMNVDVDKLNETPTTIGSDQGKVYTEDPFVMGTKYDSDKPRWGLLPFKELEEVVDVLTFGSKKYADDNWKYVDNAPERYYDAAFRHLTQWRFAKELENSDLKYDDETGKNHLAHAICCMLFMMWFDNNNQQDIGKANDYD